MNQNIGNGGGQSGNDQMYNQQQNFQQGQNDIQQTPLPPSPLFPKLELSSSDQSNNFISPQNDDQNNGEAMDSSTEPKWKRKKIPGLKVNRKLKRLRMDQRLRKTLMPKNAIMVLNEMKSGVQFVFPETPSQNSLFLVHAQLDGKTYVGQGQSKPLARQNAAENALKCLVLEKMEAAEKLREDTEKLKVQSSTESLAQQEQQPDQNQEKIDSSANDITTMDCTNGVDEKDDIPWRALANFALYKLLNEWQNQGTVVMMPKPGSLAPVSSKIEPKVPIAKELPENSDKIHPVMLLNQMRPGIAYKEISRSGTSPNIFFTLAVEADGKVFDGTAKNKKEAKKLAAISALKALYGVTYSDDNKEPDSMDLPLTYTNVLDGFVPQQEPQNPIKID